MLEKSAVPDQWIVRLLSLEYGLEIKNLTLLSLGADQNAAVYKAEEKDSKSYFVKVKKGCVPDHSGALLEILQKAGVKQIVPPIPTIHGPGAERIEDFTILVYPFIDGEDGFHRKLTKNQWVELGQTLRQIHEIKVPLFFQEQIRKERYSSKWREKVRFLYSHLTFTPDDLAMKMAQTLKEQEGKIRRLVERSEKLSQVVSKESVPFVLCHSDIHAGNVLLGTKGAMYIVDWDDPILAPKERDLMFIGGGVGNVWNDPSEEKLFYEGYGKVEIHQEVLAYYRHERIVEDIAIYGEELLLGERQNEDKALMYQHFIEQFAPRGVVEIAFKTDEEL